MTEVEVAAASTNLDITPEELVELALYLPETVLVHPALPLLLLEDPGLPQRLYRCMSAHYGSRIPHEVRRKPMPTVESARQLVRDWVGLTVTALGIKPHWICACPICVFLEGGLYPLASFLYSRPHDVCVHRECFVVQRPSEQTDQRDPPEHWLEHLTSLGLDRGLWMSTYEFVARGIGAAMQLDLEGPAVRLHVLNGLLDEVQWHLRELVKRVYADDWERHWRLAARMCEAVGRLVRVMTTSSPGPF